PERPAGSSRDHRAGSAASWGRMTSMSALPTIPAYFAPMLPDPSTTKIHGISVAGHGAAPRPNAEAHRLSGGSVSGPARTGSAVMTEASNSTRGDNTTPSR